MPGGNPYAGLALRARGRTRQVWLTLAAKHALSAGYVLKLHFRLVVALHLLAGRVLQAERRVQRVTDTCQVGPQSVRHGGVSKRQLKVCSQLREHRNSGAKIRRGGEGRTILRAVATQCPCCTRVECDLPACLRLRWRSARSVVHTHLTGPPHIHICSASNATATRLPSRADATIRAPGAAAVEEPLRCFNSASSQQRR
eukprot:scaffold1903_cov396-Prasinococcus_capsulatus_cf.AAC.10